MAHETELARAAARARGTRPRGWRNVRLEATLWSQATCAARDLGYRDLDVYVADHLREVLSRRRLDGPPPPGFERAEAAGSHDAARTSTGGSAPSCDSGGGPDQLSGSGT